jgi:hypothetical protein
MSELITYEYVKGILDNVSLDNKLSFIQFQQILSYLYKKREISIRLANRKSIINHNLSLVSDIMSKLELIITQGLVEDPEDKEVMVKLIEDFKTKKEGKGGIV